jgi:hypothetical protein
MVHTGGKEIVEESKIMRSIIGILLIMGSSACWSRGEPVIDPAVEVAREDLAKRLQIPVEEITVVSQTEKDWPDRSMGCPRKDMNYAQVLTNGSELILAAGGRQYSYHQGGSRPYFYCANPAKKSGVPIGTPRADT